MRDRLRAAIEHAAEFLPAQGPITVFVAQNTLEPLEDVPFDEGVLQGAKCYHAEPYLLESRYREEYEKGRIRVEDLAAVLEDDLGPGGLTPVAKFGSRFDIRLMMLRFPLRQATGHELRWFLVKTDALLRFRDEAPFSARRRMIAETRRWIQRLSVEQIGGVAGAQTGEVAGVIAELMHEHSAKSPDRWTEPEWEAFTLAALWRICRHGIHLLREPKPKPGVFQRHRDVLLQSTGHDSDLLVNELLSRFCGSFLDQGFSQWPLPDRKRGFAKAFAGIYGNPHWQPERWRHDFVKLFASMSGETFDPVTSIAESLERLGVPEADWEPYLTETFLALRGWAGMIRQMELRGDRVVRPIPAGSLLEYLAVRLILECAAIEFLAREHLNYDGPLRDLKKACLTRQRKPSGDRLDQRAFVLFQLAQLLGWLPKDLLELNPGEWDVLVREVESFSDLERRRIYHLAYERIYRIQLLDALTFHAKCGLRGVAAPLFQLICCLDDREESLRRHLEEVAPEAETFGMAGYFNLPIYYRGVTDAHFAPLCPIVMRPRYWVLEEPRGDESDGYAMQTSARKLFGHMVDQLQRRSQTFWGGAVIATALGALATFPLVARVLFPRLAARLRTSAGLWVVPKDTRLRLRRETADASSAADGIGLAVEEMATCAESLLREIGLISNFAPLVVISGHCSSSLNNPHKSAYDCGACGGGSGGPNARAVAQILNQPDVRAKLKERGIEIPAGTRFVGAVHNTCIDSVTMFDLDLLPESHAELLQQLRLALDEACRRNAHERARRFLSADLQLTFEEALRHAEARSEDLAQARPEYGHCTVACCIVGRRSRTRGLFMDRRAFLASYDPEQDDEEFSVLTRVMTPIVPVCGGINLQYFFSHIDSRNWGSGSKLPHNITGMLGVMDGTLSDLRHGLPWQAVEIHEPLRLTIVIETPLSSMATLFSKLPTLENVARNGWVYLAVLDPGSDQIWHYHGGKFEPYLAESQLIPRASSSWEWYHGWREPLPFAMID